MDIKITTDSAEQTIEVGKKLGEQLKGGEVLAICGSLGSGKTHLIKGIAAGADAVDEGQVNSPTFVLVNEYGGRLEIYHIDAYRLDSVEEFERIGFDDFLHPGAVVLIEWADKIESALQAIDYIRIELSHSGQTQRTLHFQKMPDHITL